SCLRPCTGGRDPVDISRCLVVVLLSVTTHGYVFFPRFLMQDPRASTRLACFIITDETNESIDFGKRDLARDSGLGIYCARNMVRVMRRIKWYFTLIMQDYRFRDQIGTSRLFQRIRVRNLVSQILSY